jgi:hypothetical protein
MYVSRTKLLFYKTTKSEEKMTRTINAETECLIQLENKRSNIYRNIEETISEAVDASFSLFGETFKDLVYSELEAKFQIEKQDIPYRINDFAAAIEEIYGVGAKLLETKIIQALHERIKGFIYIPRGKDLVFTDYIESLRQLP